VISCEFVEGNNKITVNPQQIGSVEFEPSPNNVYVTITFCAIFFILMAHVLHQWLTKIIATKYKALLSQTNHVTLRSYVVNKIGRSV